MNWSRCVLMLSICLAVSFYALPLTAQQVDSSTWGKNTPGLQLATHEGPRQQTSSGVVLMYNLLGKGFPAGMPYNLWGWGEGKQPQKMMEGVSFDKRGVLVCSGRPGFCSGSEPDDPINIKTKAAAGERKRFAVVSPDGKIAAFAEAIPLPAKSDHQ